MQNVIDVNNIPRISEFFTANVCILNLQITKKNGMSVVLMSAKLLKIYL